MVTQREPERYRAKDVGHFLNPVTALLSTSRKALAGLGGLQIRPSAIHVKLFQELSVLSWKGSVWGDFRRHTLPNIYNRIHIALYHSLTVSQNVNPFWCRDLQPLPVTKASRITRSTLPLNIRLHLLSTKSWQDNGYAVAVLGTQHKNKCLFFLWKACGMTRTYEEK